MFHKKLKKKSENILICDEIFSLFEKNESVFMDFYGCLECDGVVAVISHAAVEYAYLRDWCAVSKICEFIELRIERLTCQVRTYVHVYHIYIHIYVHE
jgi:hypothetical protein